MAAPTFEETVEKLNGQFETLVPALVAQTGRVNDLEDRLSAIYSRMVELQEAVDAAHVVFPKSKWAEAYVSLRSW